MQIVHNMSLTITIFQQEMLIDKIVKDCLLTISSPFFDRFFILISYAGSSLAFITLGLLSSAILIVWEKRLESLLLISCLFSNWLTMIYLKSFFGRARPAGEQLLPTGGFSFPSGHAMLSMAFYGFLAYIIMKEKPGREARFLAIFLYVLVFLIGLSRVYLNVHYASDVLAGFLFGGLFLLLFIKVLKQLNNSNRI